MYIFLICKCKENQLLSAKEKKGGGGQLERRPSLAAFSEGHVVHDKRRIKTALDAVRKEDTYTALSVSSRLVSSIAFILHLPCSTKTQSSTLLMCMIKP